MTASIPTRLTSSRLNHLSTLISKRGQTILESLAKLRLATTGQLERLHFEDCMDGARRRTAQKTLARLAGLGVICPLERRIGGVRSGSAGMVWALSTAGQHLVTKAGPAGGRDIRRPWTPSLPFVQHRLDITELYVRLVDASRAGELELLDFAAEPSCWRSYIGPHGSPSWIKPDASALTAHGDYEWRWLIEVDRSTESPTVLARKAETYVRYAATGREQAAHEVFPIVLFIVPTPERLTATQTVIARLPESSQRLFQATTQDQAIHVMKGGDQ